MPVHSPDRSAEAAAEPTGSSLERVFGLLRRALPVDGMSLTAASTLQRLEAGGDRRLTELAGMEGITQPAMTQLVSRLERTGLAQRRADPQDGRVVLVTITPAGRAVLHRRRTGRAKRLTELLAQLSEADRAAIAAALPALDRLSALMPATAWSTALPTQPPTRQDHR